MYGRDQHTTDEMMESFCTNVTISLAQTSGDAINELSTGPNVTKGSPRRAECAVVQAAVLPETREAQLKPARARPGLDRKARARLRIYNVLSGGPRVHLMQQRKDKGSFPPGLSTSTPRR